MKSRNKALLAYTNAFKRECAITDIAAAYKENPRQLMADFTDQPQETLNHFSQKYGISLNANNDLPVILCHLIKVIDGQNLQNLLDAEPKSAANLLKKFNKKATGLVSASQHITVFGKTSHARNLTSADAVLNDLSSHRHNGSKK